MELTLAESKIKEKMDELQVMGKSWNDDSVQCSCSSDLNQAECSTDLINLHKTKSLFPIRFNFYRSPLKRYGTVESSLCSRTSLHILSVRTIRRRFLKATKRTWRLQPKLYRNASKKISYRPMPRRFTAL